MHKILESELVSIAHKILKLNDKSDINALYKQSQKLYETLSILKFYNDNKNRVSTNDNPEVLFDSSNTECTVETETTAPEKSELKIDEPICEKSLEEIQKNENTLDIDPVFNMSFDQIAFERVSTENQESSETSQQETIPIEKPTENQHLTTLKQEEKTSFQNIPIYKTINDAFAKTISIDLNDRIAFEKNLFNDSAKDFNRIISQLNTLETYEEAKNFIEQVVKPDFNFWQDKQAYEQRLMSLIEKRFL